MLGNVLLAAALAAAPGAPGDLDVDRALARAEGALFRNETDVARSLLTPWALPATPASVPLGKRLRAARLLGDVELAALRGHPAEEMFRLVLRLAAGRGPEHTDELLRAHLGLLMVSAFHAETIYGEAHLRFARTLLDAASPGARADYMERLAYVRYHQGCFPCRPDRIQPAEASMLDAIEAATEAIELRRRTRPGSEGPSLRQRGAARWQVGQLDLATADTMEAVDVLTRAGGPRTDLVNALTQLGDIHLAAGNLETARAAIHEAARHLPEGPSFARFSLPTKLLEVAADGDRGDRDSWACGALESVESMRRYLRPSRESRAGWANIFARAYRYVAESLLADAGPSASLALLERSRGLLLTESLERRNQAGPGVRPSAPNALRSELRSIQSRLIGSDGTLDPAVSARVWELRAVLDAPYLAPLPRPWACPRFDDLPEGTLVLYLGWIEKSSSVLFLLERGRAPRAIPLAMSHRELLPLLQRIRELLVRGEGDARSLVEVSSTLYEGLFGTVDADIERAERLVIATDGFQELIPFPALLRIRGEDARFLGTWKPMSRLPSLSALAALRRRPAAPVDGGVAVFANPAFRGLEPLPNAGREGHRVAAIWGKEARSYHGMAATKGRLTREAARARVLHVATHGIYNTLQSLGAGLAFAPEAPGDDGILRAWELLHDPTIRSDLVVLSGCETGASDWIAIGEGSFDLARHFVEAGAGAVLSATWRVPDEATATLMEAFHRELAAGRSPDEALRAAQDRMSTTERWAHPFNWAAFRLFGWAGGGGLDAAARSHTGLRPTPQHETGWTIRAWLRRGSGDPKPGGSPSF